MSGSRGTQRILFVNTVASGGGAARMAGTLFDELGREAGIETRLAIGRGPHTDDPNVVRITSPVEVVAHGALTRLTGLQGYGTPWATRRLERLVHSWKPDVVHLHNLHGYYLDLELPSRLRSGGYAGPLVWTLHDTWAFTGRCAYFEACTRWKEGCGHCPDLRRYPRTLFDTSAWMWHRKRSAFSGALGLTLVCPSAWLADAVSASFLGQTDTRVVPNGVDTDRFVPVDGGRFRETHAIPPHHRIVLFAANNLTVERKGGLLAEEVMERLACEDITVVTIGTTTEGALPTGPHIRHLGYVGDPEQVAEVFGAADIFCILSLDENFPTTVLEALAAGTPVVGFRVGGIPEQVTPDVGRLHPPADVDGVVTTVLGLAEDEIRLEGMARRARERAVREFSTRRFIERHRELYDELLATPG